MDHGWEAHPVCVRATKNRKEKKLPPLLMAVFVGSVRFSRVSSHACHPATYIVARFSLSLPVFFPHLPTHQTRRSRGARSCRGGYTAYLLAQPKVGALAVKIWYIVNDMYSYL